MAGPHVAGLVALIISANPALAGNVDRIEDIIEQTAVPKPSNEGAASTRRPRSRTTPTAGAGSTRLQPCSSRPSPTSSSAG